MVRPRSMSVLLGCTITNWNALITTVYVRQIHCQHVQMFLSLFHSVGVAWPTPPPLLTYTYARGHKGWMPTLVSTMCCSLVQSNGSLTCRFASKVTFGVYNEEINIFTPPPLRWMIRNLKNHSWEWMAGVYGNLIIPLMNAVAICYRFLSLKPALLTLAFAHRI